MKRLDAIKKLQTVCARVDSLDFSKFHVLPVRMFAFGSILTDKPNPRDLDLIFQYKTLNTYTGEMLMQDLSHGKTIPGERARIELRRNMKMIRIETLEDTKIEHWRKLHFMMHDIPKIKQVWGDSIDS